MLELHMDVIEKAYGWTLASTGEIHGLIMGDMGYDGTGIFIPEDHLDAYVHYHPRHERALERIKELEAQLKDKNG